MYLDLRFTDSGTLIPLATAMVVKLVYNSGHTVLRYDKCYSCWDWRSFGHKRHGPKSRGAAVPLFRGAGSPSNTMSSGPLPTSVPSDVLISSTVWPQHTKVTRQSDTQTDRQWRSYNGNVKLQVVHNTYQQRYSTNISYISWSWFYLRNF